MRQVNHIGMWVITLDQPQDVFAPFIRSLRVMLQRIHAERTCLIQILLNLATGKIVTARQSQASYSLLYYLNKAVGAVSQLEKQLGSIAGAEAAQIAREVAEFVNPGERAALVSILNKVRDIQGNLKISNIRPDIIRKTFDYLGVGLGEHAERDPVGYVTDAVTGTEAFVRQTIKNIAEYESCFISYSSKEEALAAQLNGDLRNKGVRCWFAPTDLKIGAEIRTEGKCKHLRDRKVQAPP